MQGIIKGPVTDEEKSGIKRKSPIVLAYIGDAIYEVFVRNYVLEKGFAKVNELHRASTKFVKASGQAESVKQLENILTYEEQSIVRRGRNHKNLSVPKNAKLMDYKLATGFEALIGFLYLSGQQERLEHLVNESIAIIEANG